MMMGMYRGFAMVQTPPMKWDLFFSCNCTYERIRKTACNLLKETMVGAYGMNYSFVLYLSYPRIVYVIRSKLVQDKLRICLMIIYYDQTKNHSVFLSLLCIYWYLFCLFMCLFADIILMLFQSQLRDELFL